jgi:uncharacterized protein YecE (DUF72 family)
MPERILVGTAGWSIPRAVAPAFAGEGTHLQRYAQVLPCAEINSSFHRPHKPAVYAKWAASTPDGFRFAVKVPRTITHDLKLRRARQPLVQFLDESSGLGDKRGPLLVQLPPSLAFDSRVAGRFFELFRASYQGLAVCEPRHPTWFEPSAERLLAQHHVARVAADPAPVPGAERQGGWPGLVYFRLHGSPRRYWSSYDTGYLARLEQQLRAVPALAEAWCVFDNTASGAALENAWALQAILDGGARA